MHNSPTKLPAGLNIPRRETFLEMAEYQQLITVFHLITLSLQNKKVKLTRMYNKNIAYSDLALRFVYMKNFH